MPNVPRTPPRMTTAPTVGTLARFEKILLVKCFVIIADILKKTKNMQKYLIMYYNKKGEMKEHFFLAKNVKDAKEKARSEYEKIEDRRINGDAIAAL